MRRFVVVGHDAPTTPDFPLDDLPGSAGRLDVLARAVIEALLHSHGIRTQTRLWLVLGDEISIRFDGNALRNLHPDERSTAALIRSALERRSEAIGHRPVEVSPGLEVRRWGLATVLEELAEDGTVLRLTEAGDPIAEAEQPTDPIFILSDHRDFSPEEDSLLDQHADASYSLGPIGLHTTQAITIAHNWLDTAGFRVY